MQFLSRQEEETQRVTGRRKRSGRGRRLRRRSSVPRDPRARPRPDLLRLALRATMTRGAARMTGNPLPVGVSNPSRQTRPLVVRMAPLTRLVVVSARRGQQATKKERLSFLNRSQPNPNHESNLKQEGHQNATPATSQAHLLPIRMGRRVFDGRSRCWSLLEMPSPVPAR